jgi:hypothetical protein
VAGQGTALFLDFGDGLIADGLDGFGIHADSGCDGSKMHLLGQVLCRE